jgi:hypothetical protein
VGFYGQHANNPQEYNSLFYLWGGPVGGRVGAAECRPDFVRVVVGIIDRGWAYIRRTQDGYIGHRKWAAISTDKMLTCTTGP